MPVYKASGTIKSLIDMVAALSDRYRFSLVTSAYDPRKRDTYGEVIADCWQEYLGIRIYYASYGKRGAATMRRCMAEARPDMLYCQSLFDPIFTGIPLALVRVGAVSKIPRLVAPRGELNPGALAISPLRKKLYLAAVRHGTLGRDIHVHATTEEERDAAMQWLHAPHERIYLANDIKFFTSTDQAPPPKRAGEARFAYAGRIAPIKNLHLALQFLAQQQGSIDFDIYGPPDHDVSYWHYCQQQIAAMPEHVRVHCHGSIGQEQVMDALRTAHFFLLPTAGENFGHAILEALHAGLPAIISDQTPHLHEGGNAGWALPLSDKKAWQHAVAACIAMDQATYDTAQAAAKAYAQHYHAHSTAVSDHTAMFEAVMKA